MFGNDKISTYFIKFVLLHISESVASMFDSSVISSNFPEVWKIAWVTLIFKGSKTTQRCNCNADLKTKLFDKSNNYLNHGDLLLPSQYGFSTLHFTLPLLLNGIGYWYSKVDESKIVGVLFVDLKKASSPANRSFLRIKLKYFRIQNRELSLICTF